METERSEFMIKWFKQLFSNYATNHEYWVYTKDIKVNPNWRKTPIGAKKLARKIKYWHDTGEFESKVILDKDFNLLDGYSTVYIAEQNGLDKLPVQFATEKES